MPALASLPILDAWHAAAWAAAGALGGACALAAWAWRARRRARAGRLRAQAEVRRYRSLFDQVPVGLYRNVVDGPVKMTMVNPALVAMFGYTSAEEYQEVEGDELFVRAADRQAWARKLLDAGQAEEQELLLKRKDGSPFWGAVTCRVYRDGDGQVACIDGVIQDVTRRKEAEDALEEARRRLERLATTDGLTGLLNRRTVLERLETELTRCRRLALPLALVLLDVDHFKAVNDRHGHQAGDRVLAHVGRLLRAACRSYDLAGRYGGEEFILALPHADASQGRAAAERLRQRLAAAPVPLGDGEALAVTASLGVAVAAEGVDTADALVAAADQALYKAKAAGRNRVWPAPSAALPG
ncbi:MAG: GGDEF domain-containing protein [Candidatus Brocadiia bacterium]